jgi:peptide/nickel transport system permease protein
VAVGLTMWVEVARVVRGQVLGIREKEFIQAAKSLGYSSLRILFRHVLPNAITPVIIISAANFASAILMEAGLSFLGIGVQPPIPSWGSMIKDHYGFIIVNKAYLAFLPGLAIMLMVLSFTLVGNGLRDALDVRRK